MTSHDRQLLKDCEDVLEKYIMFKGTPTADRILRIAIELRKRINQDAEHSQRKEVQEVV